MVAFPALQVQGHRLFLDGFATEQVNPKLLA
jgi:threonine/homoserine/homoserine lactone efflux protein